MTTIAIFGISGRTGQALTNEALARDWTVRGFGRISSTAPAGATVLYGAFDPTTLVEVVSGTDAVCCVFGPRPSSRDVFCAAATRAVVTAMQQAKCRRLVCVTGASIADTPGRSRPMEWMGSWYRRRRPEQARDRDEQERIVMASGLDWTIVKPPRLTSGRLSGRVAAAPDLTVGLLSYISRADLATFMLDEISRPRFLRQRVVVRVGIPHAASLRVRANARQYNPVPTWESS